MAGVPAPRALVVVVVPSHLEQGNGASFQTKGEEGRHYSDLLKIEWAG
jgi:hypothetical protein